MKEQVRFRDPGLTKKVAAQIKELAPPYDVKFCHVCGTHEWTITHYGLRALLPETVKVIAGPGCPVCILPAAELDAAIALALDGVTVATYGDVMRVPESKSSLQAREYVMFTWRGHAWKRFFAYNKNCTNEACMHLLVSCHVSESRSRGNSWQGKGIGEGLWLGRGNSTL